MYQEKVSSREQKTYARSNRKNWINTSENIFTSTDRVYLTTPTNKDQNFFGGQVHQMATADERKNRDLGSGFIGKVAAENYLTERQSYPVSSPYNNEINIAACNTDRISYNDINYRSKQSKPSNLKNQYIVDLIQKNSSILFAIKIPGEAKQQRFALGGTAKEIPRKRTRPDLNLTNFSRDPEPKNSTGVNSFLENYESPKGNLNYQSFRDMNCSSKEKGKTDRADKKGAVSYNNYFKYNLWDTRRTANGQGLASVQSKQKEKIAVPKSIIKEKKRDSEFMGVGMRNSNEKKKANCDGFGGGNDDFGKKNQENRDVMHWSYGGSGNKNKNKNKNANLANTFSFSRGDSNGGCSLNMNAGLGQGLETFRQRSQEINKSIQNVMGKLGMMDNE